MVLRGRGVRKTLLFAVGWFRLFSSIPDFLQIRSEKVAVDDLHVLNIRFGLNQVDVNSVVDMRHHKEE